jgi:hypothetical protein
MPRKKKPNNQLDRQQPVQFSFYKGFAHNRGFGGEQHEPTSAFDGCNAIQTKIDAGAGLICLSEFEGIMFFVFLFSKAPLWNTYRRMVGNDLAAGNYVILAPCTMTGDLPLVS